MTVLRTFTHDGTGPATAASAGYDGESGATPNYDPDAMHGSAAILFAGADGFGYLRADQPGVQVISAYLKFPALPSANTNLHAIRSGAVTLGSLQVQANGTLRLKDGGGVTQATLSGLAAADTYYRCEHRFFGDGTQQLRVYAGDDTTAIADSGVVPADAGIPDGVWVGITGGPNGDVLYDTVRLADDWTGPYVEAPPSSAYFAEWDGTSLVPLTIAEWNGASFDPLEVSIT